LLKYKQNIDSLCKHGQSIDMFNGSLVSGSGSCDGRQSLRQPARRGKSDSKRRHASGGHFKASHQQGRVELVEQPMELEASFAVGEPIQIPIKITNPPARNDHAAGDSLFQLYVREVGQVALLSRAEEVVLAARIQRGDALAREHLIRANLRLVIKIARSYENLGMPLLDLINEGNLGLMKAVEKFDPTKGGKLSTYAALWIRQQIRRALASQGKTIRLPIPIADRIYHLSQAELRLRVQLGREATDEELAQELNTTVTRLGKLRRAAARPASLDAPLGDEGNSTMAEVLPDENAATPFEQMQHRTETALVRKLVENLPDREARILRLRFGLCGPPRGCRGPGRHRSPGAHHRASCRAPPAGRAGTGADPCRRHGPSHR
jgi:RNA polymerase primary sigma factor